MTDDTPRGRRPDPFYLGGEVALQRGHSGWADRLEIFDTELLAVARMLLEAAAKPQARADFDRAQVAHDCYPPARRAVTFGLDHRHDVAAGFVHVQDLVEGAFDTFLFIGLFVWVHAPSRIANRDSIWNPGPKALCTA